MLSHVRCFFEIHQLLTLNESRSNSLMLKLSQVLELRFVAKVGESMLGSSL